MELRIRVLGALEAEVDGAAVALPAGRRVRGLLAWLALHPGPQPRSRLAGWFWPEVPDVSARASLRSAIWALRRALGPGGAGTLAADRESVGFRAEALRVDVSEFERLVSTGRLREAVGLCRGELLYHLDDDWVFEARDRHAEQLAAALRALAREDAAAGDAWAAVGWARRRAALLPHDEAAGRDLMGLLARAGDIPGALLCFDRLRRRLRRDLGVDPSPATRQLAEEVRERARPHGGTAA